MTCHRETVKIGRKSFTAKTGSGCGRSKAPRWGKQAKAAARARAARNPAFRAAQKIVKDAAKECGLKRGMRRRAVKTAAAGCVRDYMMMRHGS